jgi:uncharacterized membrane protein
MKKTLTNSFFLLSLIIILSIILRFWQLELKPMWIDEILTALFTLGKNYDLIPVNTIFTFSELDKIFRLNTPTNCGEITHNLIAQSTHPPIYFCLTNYWLTINNNSHHSLIWQLRSFPALIGVITIGAIYYLNRLAFSAQIALSSAAIMAVSPFAVYLSQEARHYTLPVLFITLSLIVLIKIQQELEQTKIISKTWLLWVIINSISFYIHYFCLISFIAQIGTIIFLIYRFKIKEYLIVISYCIIPILLFIPWFPILIKHFTSPTTGWLSKPEHINPILQTIISWMLMIITLPIENQPLIIQLLSGLIILGFSLFILVNIWKNLPLKNISFLTILSFILWVLLQFAIIVYLLKKDLTVAPRYNFIYYPAVVSLLAVTLPRKTQLILILVGIISSAMVVNNLAFQKPYQPEIVSQKFNQSSAPLMVILGYESSQEMALELSYLMELKRIRDNQANTIFYFTERTSNYESMWTNLAQLSLPVNPENVWFFTPHLKQENYPQSINIGQENICLLDKQEYYKLSFPYFYQKYNCHTNDIL